MKLTPEEYFFHSLHPGRGTKTLFCAGNGLHFPAPSTMADAGKHFLPSYLFTEKTVGTPAFPLLLRRANGKSRSTGKASR